MNIEDRCPKCKGLGKITVSIRCGANPGRKYRPCDKCDGTGTKISLTTNKEKQ